MNLTDAPFALQPHLDRLTHAGRRSACTARTPKELQDWQRQARTTLSTCLGLHHHTDFSWEATLLAEVQRDGYREQRWQLAIDEGVSVNMYLLRPPEGGGDKPVLVMHGHHPNVQYCIGNFPDEETRERQLAKDGNYAQALVQAGHLVCAIEQRGFGARISEGRGQDWEKPWTDRHLFLHYLHHGRCLQGERVWDAMRVLDWFLQLDGVCAENLACTGNSGGGTTTLYLSALDERVKISVPGSAFSSYEHSILSKHFSHCLCNYVPGLGRELESGDVAAMIAPRSLCIINGEEDLIFPATQAKEQFETVQAAYDAAGTPSRCALKLQPGGHRYHVPVALKWIREWEKGYKASAFLQEEVQYPACGPGPVRFCGIQCGKGFIDRPVSNPFTSGSQNFCHECPGEFGMGLEGTDMIIQCKPCNGTMICLQGNSRSSRKCHHLILMRRDQGDACLFR